MTVTYPLRQQRRKANRCALIDAAESLFAEHGFEKTTMCNIADSAELHVQTLYNHFPTKQSIATALEGEKLRLARSNSPLDTLEFWSHWVELNATTQLTQDGGIAFFRYIHASETDPRIAGVRAGIARAYVEVLADGIAEDFGFNRRVDRLPIVIAYMLWGANADAVKRWMDKDGEADLRQLAVDAATEVGIYARQLLDHLPEQQS